MKYIVDLDDTLVNTTELNNKVNFSRSISYLTNIVHDDMLIYENNMQFFNNSKSRIVDTIQNTNFYINGYLVNV